MQTVDVLSDDAGGLAVLDKFRNRAVTAIGLFRLQFAVSCKIP